MYPSSTAINCRISWMQLSGNAEMAVHQDTPRSKLAMNHRTTTHIQGGRVHSTGPTANQLTSPKHKGLPQTAASGALCSSIIHQHLAWLCHTFAFAPHPSRKAHRVSGGLPNLDIALCEMATYHTNTAARSLSRESRRPRTGSSRMWSGAARAVGEPEFSARAKDYAITRSRPSRQRTVWTGQPSDCRLGLDDTMSFDNESKKACVPELVAFFACGPLLSPCVPNCA